jgi:hypothetical protein
MPEENRPISAGKRPECHESGGRDGGISAARRENFQVPDPLRARPVSAAARPSLWLCGEISKKRA